MCITHSEFRNFAKKISENKFVQTNVKIKYEIRQKTNKKLEIQMTKKKIGPRNNLFLASRFCNTLPNEIKNAKNFKFFYKQIKAHLLLSDRGLIFLLKSSFSYIRCHIF